MVNPSDGRIKHFACLLYGRLRVPAFGAAVWRGCRHMATPHPRSRGVQTSRGIALASVDGARLLVKHLRRQGMGKAELVTLASEPGWERSWLSPAPSNHGAECSGAQGRCEMHENVLLPSCYETCWYEGSAGGAGGSCQTRTGQCDEPWLMPSRGKCLSVLSQQVLSAPEILGVRLGIQVYNTSTLSILYLLPRNILQQPFSSSVFHLVGLTQRAKIQEYFSDPEHVMIIWGVLWPFLISTCHRKLLKTDCQKYQRETVPVFCSEWRVLQGGGRTRLWERSSWLPQPQPLPWRC